MSSEAVEEVESSQDDDALLLRRKRRHVGGAIEGLNLTAMMDMMTIILVFLIKQFASAPENIQVNDQMMPPKSKTQDSIQPTVSVFISKEDIMVDYKSVVKLTNGKVSGDPIAAMVPLFQALDLKRKIGEKLAEKGGAPFDGTLMVVADEETTYDLLSAVLYQAGNAHFSSYRMITRMK